MERGGIVIDALLTFLEWPAQTLREADEMHARRRHGVEGGGEGGEAASVHREAAADEGSPPSNSHQGAEHGRRIRHDGRARE